jgi:mono/diheme cytochrome c family protein
MIRVGQRQLFWKPIIGRRRRVMARRNWWLIVTTVFVTFTGRAASPQGPAGGDASVQLTPFAREKAEALLRRHLPCLGCHSLNGEGSKLAPDLATVRQRRAPEYIARMVTDPQGTVAGTIMPHTPMPPAMRALVIRYLGGNPPDADVPTPGPAARSADTNGAALYARFCTACHGSRGNGDGPNARSLPVPPARHASREAMSARPDDSLYDTIAGGGAIMNRSPRMPAYGTTLSPAQIRALVRHIRSLCDCAGPAWSTDGRGTSHD